MNAGWLIAMGAGPDLVEPRRALQHVLDTVDRVIGQPLVSLLKEMPVRRLTIIPHDAFHLVPFWALPSLSEYQVMLTPSAAQFLAARAEPRRIEPHALVVGNPTEDLKLAAVEADRVAYHLKKGGYAVDIIEGASATEATLTEKITGASIFHFSGHSRSNLVIPTRSALEVNPGSVAETDDGQDLLLKLAAQANWQPVYQLAGTEWIKIDNEQWADLADWGRPEERFNPSARRIELRLEHSAKGTLLGRYEWINESGDAANAYGERYRLSELWTAGDILTEHSFINCGFAFLSSCEAGAGGITFPTDEFAGLPAALQLAGVATIVSPLWPVRVEVAAIFADLFYAALSASHREVDMLALVHQTQQQLRRMHRDVAVAAIARLGEARREDRTARLLLDVTRRRFQESDEAHPFAHPYDWAAFQVTGTPTVIVPFAGQSVQEVADVNDVSSPIAAGAKVSSVPGEGLNSARHSTDFLEAAVVAHSASPDDGTDPTEVSRRPGNVFELGDGVEKLITLAGVERLKPMVAHSASGDDGTDPTEVSRRPDNVFELGDAAEKLITLGDERLKPMAAGFIYKRGLAYQRAEEIEKALADFVMAAQLDPSRVDIRINLGQLYAACHDWEQALVHYTLARISMGLACGQLGNREAALENLGQAIAQEPGEDIAYLAHKALAEMHLEGELYDAALDHFTNALSLRPEDAMSYLSRAHVHHQQKRPTEAIADVNRALLFLPDSAIAYNLRGLVLRDGGEFDRALADFDKALAIDPTIMEALYNRGLTYADCKDYPRAIGDFDAAILLAPDQADLYPQRGLAYMYLGEYERAIADHNHALSLDSRNVAAYYNRACVYSVEEEVGSIVADLTTAFQHDPSAREQARSDPDLQWARQFLSEVRELLV
jgi:tetratricopeptide (TPR) repeat protein/CHAT domain-containing protein